jgi:hypothetical protein
MKWLPRWQAGEGEGGGREGYSVVVARSVMEMTP